MALPGIEASRLVTSAIQSVLPKEESGVSGASFSSFLASAAENALRSLPVAEDIATKGVAGDKPPQQVVMAILEAERNLQTIIAIRDKVVSAYQEISRMPI